MIFLFSIASFYVVTSKMYGGKCPSVGSETKDLDCQVDSEMKVVGAVTTTASTLNLFHNQYSSLKCLNVFLTCIGSKDYSVSFNIKCNALDQFKFCYPILMKNRDNARGTNELEFSFQPSYECNQNDIENQLYILDYVDAEFVLIWGCWEINENFNEQGVWILSQEGALPEKDYRLRALNLLNNINPELTNDLLYLDSNSNETCECNDCNYFMQCQLTEKESPASPGSGKCYTGAKLLFCLCITIFLATMFNNRYD